MRLDHSTAWPNSPIRPSGTWQQCASTYGLAYFGAKKAYVTVGRATANTLVTKHIFGAGVDDHVEIIRTNLL